MSRLRFVIPLLLLCSSSAAFAQDKRANLVKEDLAKFNEDEYWIYDDLAKGVAKARETGKPLLIVFR